MPNEEDKQHQQFRRGHRKGLRGLPIGVQVACLTGNHQKEWRYYPRRRSLPGRVQRLPGGHPAYPLQLRAYKDPDWNALSGLQPRLRPASLSAAAAAARQTRQEGVGVPCLAFPVGKHADQIAPRSGSRCSTSARRCCLHTGRRPTAARTLHRRTRRVACRLGLVRVAGAITHVVVPQAVQVQRDAASSSVSSVERRRQAEAAA